MIQLKPGSRIRKLFRYTSPHNPGSINWSPFGRRRRTFSSGEISRARCRSKLDVILPFSATREYSRLFVTLCLHYQSAALPFISFFALTLLFLSQEEVVQGFLIRPIGYGDMSSFRPYPPLPPPVGGPPPVPNQNHPFPPTLNPQFQPYPSQPHGGYPASGADASGYGRIPPGSAPHPGFADPFNLPASQQQYPYAPSVPQAPPPPSGAYPPPPPPPQSQPSMYYPSSQYPIQYNPPSQPPPPPPSASPPPPPSVPPPPSPPPPSLSNQVQSAPPAINLHHHIATKVAPPSGRQQKPSLPPKQQKPPPGPSAGRPTFQSGGPNGISGRIETEEERRLRKKREYEKQKQEEKRLLFLKQSQSTVLQKTQMLAGNARPNGSMTGSRMTDRRTTPFLGGDRIENRLKKPTTFICKMKFRNELPDPTTQPKLLAMNKDKDRYEPLLLLHGFVLFFFSDFNGNEMCCCVFRFSRYKITSIEKMLKPKLYVEQDLGIPLDLLDMSIYNPHAVRLPLAHEDEELLREEEVVTPIKQEGIRRKERPTDKGVSWLVKTQYISPISTEAAKMSLSEKQAKEMRESREGRNLFLENLNNREKQIQAIEESFRAAKLPPVHQSKPGLEPVEILPLLPFFDKYEDQFVMVNFDGDPTADSEQYNKLDRSILDELESQAIMKSFIVNGSDPNNPDKFLAYMAPAPDELYKDKKTENEDTTYTWLREYHWDLGQTMIISEQILRIVVMIEMLLVMKPLPTKLVLQKKAKEGRSVDEAEHFLAPSKVTVRNKSANTVAESNEYEEISGKNGKPDGVKRKGGASSMYDDDLEEERHKFTRTDDIDQLSGEEELLVWLLIFQLIVPITEKFKYFGVVSWISAWALYQAITEGKASKRLGIKKEETAVRRIFISSFSSISRSPIHLSLWATFPVMLESEERRGEAPSYDDMGKKAYNGKPDGVKRKGGTSSMYDDDLEEERHKFMMTK
ncbi:hypothetical protein ZIOFF_005484 [Zingiber officinale]|uniref:Uncharacterized protein n=1 Tax=Zingiber officinale TaxID=94328 RepID=A0A8J5HR03_ZINOF|nr:hypothetical protein ZIOFF_005484 [Zingiber officinale]